MNEEEENATNTLPHVDQSRTISSNNINNNKDQTDIKNEPKKVVKVKDNQESTLPK